VSGARAALAGPPDGAQLRAAALAALAEGCILAMPAHLVLSRTVFTALPATPFALGSVAVFVAGTALMCRFRGAPNVSVIAGAVSVLAALAAGGIHLMALVFSILVAGLVAFRGATLAFRDWRDPLHGEIAWGALAIGAEAALGAGAGIAEWRIPLAAMIPVFFAASLWSRAITVWHEADADPVDARPWLGRIRGVVAAYVVGVLVVAAAALQGGVFERLGSVLAPFAAVIRTVVGFVLQLVLRPIFWLLSRFQVSTEAWQRFLGSVRRGRQGTSRLPASPEAFGGSISRILGFVLFCLLAWGLTRALRAMRRPVVTSSTGSETTPVVRAPLLGTVVPRTDWRHRSLPADRVRRWYAQALLELERRGLRKDPSLTPAEFAREVGRTLPELGAHLDPLTRAYEEVRYGNLRADDETIRDLHAHHRSLLAGLRQRTGNERRHSGDPPR
jgi:hypothetical protein